MVRRYFARSYLDFNSRRYFLDAENVSKREADSIASRYRKSGYYARVVKTGTKWSVYQTPKMQTNSARAIRANTGRDLKTVKEIETLSKKGAPYFFKKDTMSWFGDTKSNFKVGKKTTFTNNMGKKVTVYPLIRKKPTRKGAPAGTVAYFNADTGEVEFRKR